MNDMLAMTSAMALAGIAGAVIGLIFFGGLWWSLRRAFASSRPALWVGGSLLLRMACAEKLNDEDRKTITDTARTALKRYLPKGTE